MKKLNALFLMLSSCMLLLGIIIFFVAFFTQNQFLCSSQTANSCVIETSECNVCYLCCTGEAPVITLNESFYASLYPKQSLPNYYWNTDGSFTTTFKESRERQFLLQECLLKNERSDVALELAADERLLGASVTRKTVAATGAKIEDECLNEAALEKTTSCWVSYGRNGYDSCATSTKGMWRVIGYIVGATCMLCGFIAFSGACFRLCCGGGAKNKNQRPSDRHNDDSAGGKKKKKRKGSMHRSSQRSRSGSAAVLQEIYSK